tara:strand:+ start:3912 stop:6344 length:2433 start_codon:yes stop_codon:yes gene_type:complete
MNYQQQMPMGMPMPNQMSKPPLNNPMPRPPLNNPMPQMPPQMPQMGMPMPQMPQMPPQMTPPPLNNPIGQDALPQMPLQIPSQMQAPMESMANEMSQYGRYGDSMMVHMNPAELQGMASLSPTGELTRNPMTGQPEAFLPFLAPLLGTMFGKAVLAKAVPFLAGKTALASAIGSGLATTAATGDVKKGLLSGITGFGLGKALGAASEALSPEVVTATENLSGLEGQITSGADAIRQGTTTLSGLTRGTPEFLAQAEKLSNLQAAQSGLTGAIDTGSGLMSPLGMAKEGVVDAQQLAREGTGSLFRESPGAFIKEFGSQLMKPANLAAIGVGEGQTAAMNAEEKAMADNRRFEEDKEREYQEAMSNIDASYDQLEQDYPGYDIDRQYNTAMGGMNAGGITSINPQHYRNNLNGLQQLAGGGPIQNFYQGGPSEFMADLMTNGPRIGGSGTIVDPGASSRQSGIRGTDVLTPADLEGYRPGFDPEIKYFKDRPIEVDPINDTANNTQFDESAFTGQQGGQNFSNEGFLPPDASMLGLGEFNPQFNLMQSNPEFMQNALQENFTDRVSQATENANQVNLSPQLDGSVRPSSDTERLQDYIAQGADDVPSENLVMSDDLISRLNLGNMPFSVGAAGFDNGGITSLTKENINPRIPLEEEFAEMDRGAMTDTMESNGQLLIDRTIMAIAGRLPEEEAESAINQFISEFGSEAFSQLRERVLTEIVPNAQVEGEIVGSGGGMDDMVQGMIGDQQRVAVSPGEYIVPADVVSGIGDGSTDAGVGELDTMLNRVRMDRTGTMKQPDPLYAKAGGVLPA